MWAQLKYGSYTYLPFLTQREIKLFITHTFVYICVFLTMLRLLGYLKNSIHFQLIVVLSH